MFLIEVLDSVISYLQTGDSTYFSTVKTIDTYKGQLSDAMRNKALIKLADPLPAVYACLIDDTPIAEDPVHRVDLLVCADSKSFNKGEKQTAAYTAAAGIARYIEVAQTWTYSGISYFIDKESVKITHLITDDKYTILSINLVIKNLA